MIPVFISVQEIEISPLTNEILKRWLLDFDSNNESSKIVPGVIIVEAMAQTAGIVVSHQFKEEKDKSVLFMSVNKARFRKPVLPNQNIRFEVSFLNKVKDVYKFQGIAFHENTKVAETEFTAMITIAKK